MSKNTQAPLQAGTDLSYTITAGGTAQVLVAANANRKRLIIQNISAGNLGVNQIGGTAAIGTAGTQTLAAGASMEVLTNRTISIIGATTAQAFTAIEF